MQIAPFKLERYFAEYEFKVQYLLSPSDCESLSLRELLAMADAETLALWNDLKFSYTESAGHPLLRAEVARMYETITSDDVMIAVPEEAIFVAMHTLLQPGDHVVTLFPAYQSLYEIARSLGVDVSLWQIALEGNHWQLNIESLKQLLTDRTRLLIINFPHNPTGFLPTRDEFNVIIALARQHGTYIFSDEMYRLLEYDSSQRLPAMCDVYERGISLSGLSKTFALPGLRLGWLAARDRQLVNQWLAFKDYTTICNSAPSEILGIIALRAKEKIISRNIEIIRQNLKIANDFFAEHVNRFHWFKPNAGSIAFPKWRDQQSIERFCADMINQYGVMILPGNVFDFPGNHFRVGLGRKNFAYALTRVRDYIQAGKYH